MGLDTTHNAWHGPYSSFNTFREKLAKIEGFNLREMEGFGGSRDWNEIDSDLKPLLDHSDCEGEISWQDCKKIADGLGKILSEHLIEDPFLVEDAEQFRIGALSAFESKENLEFH